MSDTILAALILSAEIILHLMALYVIYQYSCWEQEQAMVNSTAASSFDLDESIKSESTEKLDDDGTIRCRYCTGRSKRPFTNQESAAFRAFFVWLVAASLVTDWTLLLILGMAILLYERQRSSKKRGRLPDWQLRVYFFTMLALFALLVATMAMILWSFRVYFGIIPEDSWQRHRIVAICAAISSILLGLVVVSVCSSRHGPCHGTMEDDDSDANKEYSLSAMG